MFSVGDIIILVIIGIIFVAIGIYACIDQNHEKTPEWCPLVKVVQYGPEGTLYKEK